MRARNRHLTQLLYGGYGKQMMFGYRLPRTVNIEEKKNKKKTTEEIECTFVPLQQRGP
jgi:hypothetical protein